MTATNPGHGLSYKLLESLQGLLSNYPEVYQAVLFGSRAKGTHRPNSDIDICLFAPNIRFSEFLALAEELDELVFPYSIDLILHHHIENQALLDHIDRVGIVLFSQ